MKPSLSILSYLTSIAVLCLSYTYTADAGQMSGQIGYQTYADLALNKGSMISGATNVPIYDKDGNHITTLPLVPNLGAMLSTKNQVGIDSNRSSSASLVGSQGWITSAAHCGPIEDSKSVTENLSFSAKYGATNDTKFYESYRAVATLFAGSQSTTSASDVSASRLGKLVTDAVAWDFCKDKSYLANSDNLNDTIIIRVGGGKQSIVNEPSTETGERPPNTEIAGAEEVLTAGTINLNPIQKPSETTITLTDPNLPYGDTTSSDYTFYQYHFVQESPKDANPLPIGSLPGDSGSAVIIYNKNTGKWEYLGAMSSSTCNGTGYESSFTIVGGDQWGTKVQESYQQKIDSSEVTQWNISSDGKTNGQLVSNSDPNHTINVTVLKEGTHGDTSIGDGSSTTASNYYMQDCKDWVFQNGGVNLVVTGTKNIDTGAGAIYFDRDISLQTTTHYHISSENATTTLNTAGYSIEKGVQVTTTLTGATGDEWRVVGRGGEGGMLEITGYGNNNANLNIGVGAQAYLNREGGYAVNDLKISTGAYVALGGSNQIAGDLVFGVQGGCLDLNGHDFSRDAIYAFDQSALIANYNSTATLNYSSGAHDTYLGGFHDGQAAGQSGVLNVSYQGANTGSWTLSGQSEISGNFTIQNGSVVIAGFLTPYADDLITGEAVTNPNDWQEASLKAGNINVSQQGQFVIDTHAHVSSNMEISADSQIHIKSGASYNGSISLHGAMTIEQGANLNSSPIHLYQGGSISALGGNVSVANLTLHDQAILDFNSNISLSGQIVINDAMLSQSQMMTLSLDSYQNLILDTRLGDNSIDATATITLNLSESQVALLTEQDLNLLTISLSGVILNDKATTITLVLPDEYVFNNQGTGQGNTLDFTINNSNSSFTFGDTTIVSAIPEPSSITLGLLGLTVLLTRRNRKNIA